MIDYNHELYYHTYQEAFEAYLARKFNLARKKFSDALCLRSDDPASKKMIARIETINPNQLPFDWDGSINKKYSK